MDNSTIAIIALLGVFAVLIVFAVWGYHQGFLRHVLTTMSFVVTIVVAGLLAPTFSHIVRDSGIGKSIEEGIGNYVTQSVASPLIESSKNVQEKVIGSLPLPSVVQEDLTKNNTAEEYVELKVTSFSDYLSTRLSGMAINIVTYLFLMLILFVLIRVLLFIFKVINRIPLIGGINRLLGGLIGLIEGLIIIWILCLIIMASGGTEFGSKALEVIHENDILTFLYDHNGIVIGANALFHVFL